MLVIIGDDLDLSMRFRDEIAFVFRYQLVAQAIDESEGEVMGLFNAAVSI